jgi:diacylglycerol kinase (ATP)
LLDVTLIRALSLPRLIGSLPFLYNGRIYSHSSVEFHRTRSLEAIAEETTLIEIDGEPLGKLPIRIEAIPKAIRVLFP